MRSRAGASSSAKQSGSRRIGGVHPELLPQHPGRRNHVREGGFSLRPAARLQTTIGVDPQAFGGDYLARTLEQALHRFDTWHARRMSVIYAGADSVRIGERAEAVEQFHRR